MNNITYGKWLAIKAPTNVQIQPENNLLLCIADVYSCCIGTAESNAKFIEVCQNQCYGINPDNPLTVAQSIKDMYEALKLYMKHQENTGGHYCSECFTAIVKALSKIEGK